MVPLQNATNSLRMINFSRLLWKHSELLRLKLLETHKAVLPYRSRKAETSRQMMQGEIKARKRPKHQNNWKSAGSHFLWTFNDYKGAPKSLDMEKV